MRGCLVLSIGLCMAVPVLADMPAVKISQLPLSAVNGNDGSACAVPGSVGAGAVAGGGFVYQAAFYPSDWSGSLKKLRIEQEGLPRGLVAEWDAADRLDGSTVEEAMPPETRRIYTSRTSDGAMRQTVEFKWEALSNAQKRALGVSPVDGKPDGLGQKRVDFLRGVRALESEHGGIFRARRHVLGDIVNSTPVFVGAPSSGIRGDAYRKFFDSHGDRADAVYVGANDGMLHAFDAKNGAELFAYIPDALVPALPYLTQRNYVHRSYVDGGIDVAEASVAGTWKTVLVSGMGGGAQGLFALDVSDPADFAGGAGALWEFTDADDRDMGNLIGAPSLAKFRTGTAGGMPQYQYFAVVSSGLNNYVSDGRGRFDSSGAGVLFLLSLDKPAAAAWKAGVNYFKFKLPNNKPDMPNGLSALALTTGHDGAVRYAYAGDLQGNLWRFDFTGGVPWKGAAGKLLFKAVDAEGNPQPISERPAVVYAPGGYAVLFGTGKFIEDTDLHPENFGTQSFYAIYDPEPGTQAVSSRGQLAVRMPRGSGEEFVFSGDRFDYGGDKRGWYFDFPDASKTGERSVTSPKVSYGRVFFTTVMPDDDTCAERGGRSYSLEALTGLTDEGGTGQSPQVGLPEPPILLEAGDAETGGRNPVGMIVAKRKYSILHTGSGDKKDAATSKAGRIGQAESQAGRLSWREILNWMETKKATGNGGGQ